jgi:succinoglycan biosynthesis protein ExoV
MYFYRGKVPNFGDELNTWLLPKIFPNFFDEDERTVFLGIGSILFDFHPRRSQKIVFGSGYGGYTAMPEIDDTWKFYCVRGPRTAAAFDLTLDKVAGDSAILISRHYKRKAAKPAGFAFMPHFETLEHGNWAAACEMAGVRLIDPRDPIEQVLAALDESEVLITEAMHGAIVADAIRVPWIPVYPFHRSHHMKWFDWAEALDLKLRREIILPSTVAEAGRALNPVTKRVRAALGKLAPASGRPAGGAGRSGAGPHALDGVLTRAAAASLRRATRQAPTLSSDAALGRVVEKLEIQSQNILRDFRIG